MLVDSLEPPIQGLSSQPQLPLERVETLFLAFPALPERSLALAELLLSPLETAPLLTELGRILIRLLSELIFSLCPLQPKDLSLLVELLAEFLDTQLGLLSVRSQHLLMRLSLRLEGLSARSGLFLESPNLQLSVGGQFGLSQLQPILSLV